jgi:hypothetical protein
MAVFFMATVFILGWASIDPRMQNLSSIIPVFFTAINIYFIDFGMLVGLLSRPRPTKRDRIIPSSERNTSRNADRYGLAGYHIRGIKGSYYLRSILLLVHGSPAFSRIDDSHQ